MPHDASHPTGTPPASLLDRIRWACAKVAARAEVVRIDHDRLADHAATFPVEELASPTGDPGRERRGDDEATAAFVIALDAVNYGSGYFPHLAKRPDMSGYHTIASSLRDHVDATGPLTAERLARLDAADCAAIFGQHLDGGYQEELMDLFATGLADLGRLVADEHGGSFLTFVASAGHSAEALAECLDRLPQFHDVHPYRGLEVPLYKRAQITPYDLAVAFGHAGPGRFDDLDRLTMFADNLVPHVLRVEGILAFDDELVHRIDTGEDITSGSEPEVEIRACALHAVELLVAHLRERGVATNAGQVDGVLWARGGRPRYKAVPRHRTRCTYY